MMLLVRLFDKCGKLIGFQYPAGSMIDRMAASGNPDRFSFNKPRIRDLNYSFSGLKTSFMYYLRDQLKINPDFIKNNVNDLCASLQKTIVEILLDKLNLASKQTGIKEICLAGGVSANSELRISVKQLADKNNSNVHIPPIEFSTDNAAMIAIAGYYKFLRKDFVTQEITPLARLKI